jgi:predicted ester cyclase
MSLEENKAIVRRFLTEVFNHRNLTAIDQLVAPTALDHCKQSLTLWLILAALPDFHISIKTMIAEGDEVAVISTLSGTHQGALMGIAPSNKPVSIIKADIFRVSNGKIVEIWQNGDYIGLMQQIGAVNIQQLTYHLQVAPGLSTKAQPSVPVQVRS